MKDFNFILIIEDSAGNTEEVDAGQAILRLIINPAWKLHIYRKTATIGEIKP